MLHTETFQVLGLKMFQQPILSCVRCKDPIIQLKDKITRAESLLKAFLVASLDQHLFGREIVDQLIHVIHGTLRCQELTGRDIQKGNATMIFHEMNGG